MTDLQHIPIPYRSLIRFINRYMYVCKHPTVYLQDGSAKPTAAVLHKVCNIKHHTHGHGYSYHYHRRSLHTRSLIHQQINTAATVESITPASASKAYHNPNASASKPQLLDSESSDWARLLNQADT